MDLGRAGRRFEACKAESAVCIDSASGIERGLGVRQNRFVHCRNSMSGYCDISYSSDLDRALAELVGRTGELMRIEGHVPEGYEVHGRRSPVTDAWAPIYARERDGVTQLALRLDHRHCNSRGFVHGGVIAALADNAMGLSYGTARLAADAVTFKGAVTITLSVDYTATARIGAWLEISPRVIKAGRALGFVDALVTADDAVVARASATFKLLD